MIEGPGHVPFDQIEYNMKLQRRALPRRAVLRPRPARDRHLPRLRPHHQLHRRDRGGVPRRGDALLRHAEGAPRPAEEGRREAGLHRLQDRGPRRRRRPRHPRRARPGRRTDEGPRRAQLGEALRARPSTPTPPARTTTKTSTSTPTSAPCAATTGAASASARRSSSSSSGKDEDYQWDKPKISAALIRPSSARS